MPNIVRFDCFEADLESGQLHKRGLKIKLRDQSFRVLVSLLEHPGCVVTREDLHRRLWGNEVFVDFDNNLNIVIARLREALGDSAEHPRFIETLPKHGYRFLAKVSRHETANEQTSQQRVRVLILPFLNMIADSSQDYLGDAMTDEFITELALLAPEHLAVIARTTAMHYKGSHKDIARIGRELNVDYVIEGGIRRSEDQFTLNVQLIQASDQTHLFARKYETSSLGLFDMHASIAAMIAAHIPGIADHIQPAASMSRSTRKRKFDLAAYQEYIQGRGFLAKGTPRDFERAKDHLERAIAQDPEFALGYDALAEVSWYLGYFGAVSSREAFSAGIIHALRALEIEDSAETHALLGQFHKTVEYNWPEVQREMSLALQLDPNSPLVRMRYAISYLMPHGRLDEAVAELELALEIDPLSLFPRFWLGIILLLARKFDRAVDESNKLLELDSTYFLARFVRAAGYRYQNRSDDAIAEQKKAVELSGQAASMLGWLGMTLAGSGKVAEAREVLQRLYKMGAKGYVPPSSIAWIHLGLREIDTAFEWLNRAVEECDQLMMPIKSYGFFDPIRDDSRFKSLLLKMRLGP